MTRNPPWTRDELILALDLYFRVGRKQVGLKQLGITSVTSFLIQFHTQRVSSTAADSISPAHVSAKPGRLSPTIPSSTH